MARTPSNMLPLGTKAPSFSLLDTVSGKKLSYAEVSNGQPTVLMFICNHCPFVIHLHEGLQSFVSDYSKQGVKFVAISANDVANYPQDGSALMKELFQQLNFQFPYLYDEMQDVAKAYDAACTPDFYIFNGSEELVYRGQFDGSRPGNGIPVTGSSMRKALDQLLKEGVVAEDQKPSLGCNIKWK